MRSHRALLALLLCFLLDAAMPFEPAARGGFQLEIEDQDEEGVCARRRHAERPGPAETPAPRVPTLAATSPGRVALAGREAHAPVGAADPAPAGLPRARTHAPDPASPAEVH